VSTDRALRTLVPLFALIGVTAAPAAVIVPLVEQTGSPPWAVGPLLAADGLGVIAGLRFVETRTVDQQRALIGPLAVLGMAPQACFMLNPSQPILLGALLAVSGIGQAYFSLALGEITTRVPDTLSGITNGLLNTVLRVGQGLGAIAAGVLAARFSAVVAVALLGLLGLLLAAACSVTWRQALRADSLA
jgi:predicted MFS family arabinose efflux permease